ncbi:tripartite tricarboxylate transporter permease [Chloroflexota bacterium]
MVLEAFAQALGNLTSISIWVWLLLGVIWGLVFGLVPGIGGVTAMAIFLGVALFLEPMQALPVLVALMAVSATGGSITAVLLGIPGDNVNVVTIFDGFPMTKKGEGGRALGAALTASVLGGVGPAFFTLGMVIVVLPFVMALTSMDMVFIILIGLSFVVMMSKGSMIKGLISAGVGLLLATIGLAFSTGEPRFTFGNPYLYDGIHIIVVAMGLFAIPVMVELAMKGGTIAEAGTPIKGMHDVWMGAKDVFHNWKLWLRSSLIGYVFGVMPGVGVTGALFISYGYAKASSKHPELFGTGVVEGVIGPESANNAKESGALLTTLALGVPGSVTGAMMLAALIILGFAPGPSMLTEHLDLSLTLLILLAAANVIAVMICYPLAPRMAGIARIPSRLLVPLVVGMVFVGVYVSQGLIQDVIALLIFSALGVAVRHFGYNAGALILAFILGRLFEDYLMIGLQVGGPLFFLRPISLFLILIIITIFAYGPLKRVLKRRFLT